MVLGGVMVTTSEELWRYESFVDGRKKFTNPDTNNRVTSLTFSERLGRPLIEIAFSNSHYASNFLNDVSHRKNDAGFMIVKQPISPGIITIWSYRIDPEVLMLDVFVELENYFCGSPAVKNDICLKVFGFNLEKYLYENMIKILDHRLSMGGELSGALDQVSMIASKSGMDFLYGKAIGYLLGIVIEPPENATELEHKKTAEAKQEDENQKNASSTTTTTSNTFPAITSQPLSPTNTNLTDHPNTQNFPAWLQFRGKLAPLRQLGITEPAGQGLTGTNGNPNQASTAVRHGSEVKANSPKP